MRDTCKFNVGAGQARPLPRAGASPSVAGTAPLCGAAIIGMDINCHYRNGYRLPGPYIFQIC